MSGIAQGRHLRSGRGSEKGGGPRDRGGETVGRAEKWGREGGAAWPMAMVGRDRAPESTAPEPVNAAGSRGPGIAQWACTILQCFEHSVIGV
ncbi:hypothetical protein GCM10012280_55890 [Wenjunlia tyrosinilytica]|uniref:Uncharacterized protein n=1 Tax=Wenjunlia tyrosinilytica TaxID=1544741 RepID=A0A917ZVJ9_9ACTN|nr:hypothetical protein GCM10012280_55890 [Wenjunlia tyrosinilytica]